jgi:hypothetical protein
MLTHRTIEVPARWSTWFRWLGQFLKSRTVQLSDRVSLAVASDWSGRVGKDRQSLTVAATVTATIKLTPEQVAILEGREAVPLSEGVGLRLAKPILALFNLTRVSGESLRLPEGVTVELDGWPDPVLTRLEVLPSGECRIHGSVAALPITADLVPTA